MTSALHVVGAAIIQGQKCLAAQRGPGRSLSGKWELPGGKVERGELPAAALAREIEEELGLRIEVGPFLATGHAMVGGRLIQLDVYAAHILSGVLTVREHARVAWLASHELGQLDWAEADIPCIPHLQRLLEARPPELLG